MTKKKSTESEAPIIPKDAQDEGATFDMYHFFSRWDVIAMIIFILAMIGVILYHVFAAPPVA